MRRQLLILTPALLLAAATPDGWPNWRGPNLDGMALSDAPLTWSDSEHIAWKTTVPGHGNSSPVVWGDRIFVTTAVPTGAPPAAAPAPPPQDPGQPGRGRGRGFGSSGPQAEHKLMLMAFDRKTGKQLWEQVARVATPHQGHHP